MTDIVVSTPVPIAFKRLDNDEYVSQAMIEWERYWRRRDRLVFYTQPKFIRRLAKKHKKLAFFCIRLLSPLTRISIEVIQRGNSELTIIRYKQKIIGACVFYDPRDKARIQT